MGTKRHVLTDQRSIPVSVVITSANTHDKKAATETLDSVIVERPLKKQNLCLDKGYDYPEIERESTKRRYVPHIRHRGEEKELIKLRYYYSAKRWVVIERTNSWHNRFRKLLVRYEKKSENYLALVCLACCIIVYRRIILG
ncbi:MAG: IS5 family transposase [Nitrososphaeraceae archaeon]